MFTRKETRKVLVDWKSFLSEAKENSTSVTVRLFDFDGTLFSHPDQDVNKVLSNPFMASTLSESVLQKLMEECVVTPSLKSLISGKPSGNVKNFIISKVSSTGFGPSRSEILVGLQNQSDANYVALKNVISRFDKNIDDDLEKNNTKKLSKVLNLGNLEMDPDSKKIDTKHVVMAQEDKIDKFLSAFDANIERVYVITNLARTSEDEESRKVLRIPGTSGKGQVAQDLVKRIMNENPGKEFNFEIYDNSGVNIANITDGILLADNHIPNISYNSNKERDMIYDIYEKMQRSPNVKIKKTLATRGETGGIETQDVTNRYFTKSKSNPPDTKRRFEEIKNRIIELTNYYAMRGKLTGRPHLEDRKKIVDYLSGHNFPDIAKIVDNPKGATELSDKYIANDEELGKFLDQVSDWMFNLQKFKDDLNLSFESSEEVAADTESPVEKAKQKRITRSKELAQQLPTGSDQPEQTNVPSEEQQDRIKELEDELSSAIYNEDYEAADQIKKELNQLNAQIHASPGKLSESVNKIRLVLKNK